MDNLNKVFYKETSHHLANRTGHMPKNQKDKARRYRSARVDGKVGTLENTIAKDYGLPRGSLMLVGPNGKDKRSDASTRSLLAERDEL